MDAYDPFDAAEPGDEPGAEDYDAGLEPHDWDAGTDPSEHDLPNDGDGDQPEPLSLDADWYPAGDYDLVGADPDEDGYWTDLRSDHNGDGQYDTVLYAGDGGTSPYVTA